MVVRRLLFVLLIMLCQVSILGCVRQTSSPNVSPNDQSLDSDSPQNASQQQQNSKIDPSDDPLMSHLYAQIRQLLDEHGVDRNFRVTGTLIGGVDRTYVEIVPKANDNTPLPIVFHGSGSYLSLAVAPSTLSNWITLDDLLLAAQDKSNHPTIPSEKKIASLLAASPTFGQLEAITISWSADGVTKPFVYSQSNPDGYSKWTLPDKATLTIYTRGGISTSAVLRDSKNQTVAELEFETQIEADRKIKDSLSAENHANAENNAKQ